MLLAMIAFSFGSGYLIYVRHRFLFGEKRGFGPDELILVGIVFEVLKRKIFGYTQFEAMMVLNLIYLLLFI